MTEVEPASPPQPPCNICGGTSFRPGFKGRLLRGKLPSCSGCQSVERHRMIHDVYARLRPLLGQWRLLAFAPDGSVDRKWFQEFTPSIHGRVNSLDMMQTGLPDGRYDLIMSNHVLEHVPDTFDAIAESLRVVGPEGLVHINVPSPMYDWETRDWGFADPAVNEHYRQYGADFPMLVRRKFPDLGILAVIWRDPVTDLHDVIYLLSRGQRRLQAVGALLQRVPIPVVRIG